MYVSLLTYPKASGTIDNQVDKSNTPKKVPKTAIEVSKVNQSLVQYKRKKTRSLFSIDLAQIRFI